MTTTVNRMAKAETELGKLADLQDVLLEEKRRLKRVLKRAEKLLRQVQPDRTDAAKATITPRRSSLDEIRKVVAATKDLRVTNGNLSAERIAKLYGINLNELANWI